MSNQPLSDRDNNVLNDIANALLRHYGTPALSVRYRAAQAAVNEVRRHCGEGELRIV